MKKFLLLVLIIFTIKGADRDVVSLIERLQRLRLLGIGDPTDTFNELKKDYEFLERAEVRTEDRQLASEINNTLDKIITIMKKLRYNAGPKLARNIDSYLKEITN